MRRLLKPETLLVLGSLLVLLLLALLPTGFGRGTETASARVRARILEVDNSQLKTIAVSSHGHQSLRVRLLSGRLRGAELDAVNLLTGKLELDTLHKVGDTAFAVLGLDAETGAPVHVNVLGPYRLGVQTLLLAVFALFLVLYAGKTGLKALLSFGVSVMAIWKILVPGILRGMDPILLSLAVVGFLTAVIIYLVAGLNRKGHTAFLGACSGVLATAGLSVLFGSAFRLPGAIKPFSELLLHSGYDYLDLTRLLYASVFIAASGAVMDLSMDIAAAIHELHEKRPELGRKELIRSGFSVGRSVVGTMTTTLLFAYSSSYITLLMVFMAQDIPLRNMLNLSYISADILTTLVGSFGLVTVAPFTALIAGILYGAKNLDSIQAEATPLQTGQLAAEQPAVETRHAALVTVARAEQLASATPEA